MEKSHGQKMKKELEIMESRLNALEASTEDRHQKAVLGVLKTLADNQKQMIDEFEHLKKAIDLLTLQVFQVEKRLH